MLMSWQDKHKSRMKETHPWELFLQHSILLLPRFPLYTSKPRVGVLLIHILHNHLFVFEHILYVQCCLIKESSSALRAGSLRLSYLLVNANEYS